MRDMLACCSDDVWTRGGECVVGRGFEAIKKLEMKQVQKTLTFMQLRFGTAACTMCSPDSNKSGERGRSFCNCIGQAEATAASNVHMLLQSWVVL